MSASGNDPAWVRDRAGWTLEMRWGPFWIPCAHVHRDGEKWDVIDANADDDDSTYSYPCATLADVYDTIEAFSGFDEDFLRSLPGAPLETP